jgi:hypothetical protein
VVGRRFGWVEFLAGIDEFIGRHRPVETGGTVATTGVAGQRWGAVLLLLVLGIFSLPVTAYFFDGEGSENWIVPVAIVVMAVLGAIVGSMLPGIAGPGASQQRGAIIGAVVGVVMLVLGIVVFFVLLSGFDGA